MKPTSFFDDESMKNSKKIWQKPSKGQETVNELNKQLILKGVFYKKTKNVGKSKPRVFMMDETNLYFQKNEKTDKVAGLLELNCCKLDLLQNIDSKTIDASLSDSLFGFRIIRNGRILEFYTKDQQQWKKWKNIIIYKAIQASFHEDFIVTKMIGKGSFAKVYLATKKETGIQYAIKAFNKEFMASQHKGKESLVNEIGVMRNLRCDQLINLFEVYETTNSIYFVVDILNGGELLHRVRDKGTLTEGDLKPLMRNLLLGLQYLHQKSIMHRDLKPENLLLKSKENDYDIVIADFGLATFTNIKDVLFKRCGTPGFVAPEVLAFQEGDQLYDLKCDIFSAGVIYYLLLIGKQPFQGKDYKQILRANKACEIKYDSPEFSNVSPQAKDLLMKMLEPNPLKRPSATECLQHVFIQDASTKGQQLQANNNLRNYDVEFLANVRAKGVDSQDQVGSMALHTGGIPALNGNVDTVGSLNMSNPNLNKNYDQVHGQSLFCKPRTDSIDQNMLQNSGNSPKGSPVKKGNDGNNLHKLALKNQMYQGYQDEHKGEDSPGSAGLKKK